MPLAANSVLWHFCGIVAAPARSLGFQCGRDVVVVMELCVVYEISS